MKLVINRGGKGESENSYLPANGQNDHHILTENSQLIVLGEGRNSRNRQGVINGQVARQLPNRCRRTLRTAPPFISQYYACALGQQINQQATHPSPKSVMPTVAPQNTAYKQ